MTGDELRKARIIKGLTQSELAHRIREPVARISAWEWYGRIPEECTARIRKELEMPDPYQGKKNKWHPSVRTASGVRFGWMEE